MKTSPTLDPLPKTTFVSLRCRRFFLPCFPTRKLLYFKDVDRETIQKLIEAMEVAMSWSTGVAPVWDDLLVDELRLYVRSSNSQMVHKWHDKEVPEAG